MLIFKYLVLLFLFYSYQIFSQLTQQWVALYNGPLDTSYDFGYSIAIDGLGNSFITGGSVSLTGLDFCTIKYNNEGIQQWVARYNRSNNSHDAGTTLKLDNSGNVYVTGVSYSGTQTYSVTIKYNASGIQQWVNNYKPVNGSAETVDLDVDILGNIYVTGHSYLQGDTCITIKYNGNGVQQWMAKYPGIGKNIKIDRNGDIIVAFTSSDPGNLKDMCVIKYNTNGVQQWISRFNNSFNGWDEMNSMILDSNGNVYVCGNSWHSDSMYITSIKYNSAGTQKWIDEQQFGKLYYTYHSNIALDNESNVVTLMVRSYTSNTGYLRLSKFNNSGVKQWTANYPSNLIDIDKDLPLFIDTNSNIFTSVYMNDGQFHTCILKYSETGVLQWIKRIDEPPQGYSKIYSMGMNNSGGIWITGVLQSGGNYTDIWTTKFTQEVGIKPISMNIPSSYNIYHNYPNPFNPSTIIKFDIAAKKKNASGNVTLTVYDVLGREITTLVNEDLKSGTYEAEWNASNQSGGIYFAKLTVGEYSKTIKMVLIK